MKISSAKRTMGYGLAALVTATSLVVAFLHPGVVTTELNLNDGGVWVTNSSLRMVAHVNYPARMMDAGLRTGSPSFNVFQNGEQVFLSDLEAATLAPIDVAHAELSQQVDYSGYSTVIAADTLAATDPIAGTVWVQPAAQMRPLNPEEDEPTLKDLPGVQTAVGTDGSVHAVSAQAHSVVSVIRRGVDTDEKRWEIDEENLTPESNLQISAVGEQPVVFDRHTSRLFLPNGSTQVVEGENLTLQEPGPEYGTILLASSTQLLEVPLAGGEPTIHALEKSPTGGRPSRPVRHGNCLYGAWAGTGAFLRVCPDPAERVEMTVDSVKDSEHAVFRTNRDVIVLNDTESGDVWLPEAQMILIDNWDQIESSLESEEESDEDSPEKSSETLLPERSETNTPPEAVDDDFGVRAGKTNILPVIANDSDIDGDFLTASIKTQPSIGEVSVARDGAALQIAVADNAQGASSFEYEVSDGRGGTATARVTLSVRDADTNEAPRQLLVPSVTIGKGRKVSVNALTNWYDPDGDAFYLDHVEAPTGLAARAHANGGVDVTEVGHAAGKDSVKLFVSDGRDIGAGELSVTVKENGNEPPLANTDHVIIREGSSVAFSPLGNDTDPNGDPLRLVQIEQAPVGISATMDSNLGTVTVEGLKAGTYYLGYVVTDGPSTAQSSIRVDVVESAHDAPPTAEPDLGVLPEGSQVLIDLVANDSDPTGGVLSVQRVDVPQGSALQVALIDHHMVRVSAPRGITDPQNFQYTVTNGHGNAQGSVTVLPAPAPTGSEPPELTDDQIVVRAGDVASVSVLDNDRSPANLKMTVSHELQHEIPADLGSVFISDNTIRVRGGSRAGSGRILYTVHDAAGNVATAVVNLVVVAANAENNTAPRPRDLTLRTVAGGTIEIPIPVDNVDPEGDSVSLVGIASTPKLGSATTDGNTLRYQASEEATGTDSFTYTVEDTYGAQATGTIRVGVAARSVVNQDPVAQADQVIVRPGARVAVAVTSNDIDPDGDDLTLKKDSASSTSQEVRISERSGRIVVETPETEGTYMVTYTVTDSRGGNAQGVLNVIARKEAPELAPIARDDRVESTEVSEASDGVVTVDVLANDEDPDGDIADVTVSSADGNLSVNQDQTVSIRLEDTAQNLIYTITDASGQSASALVRVPGLKITRPTANSRALPIKAKAGETVEIPINDYIVAREGRSVMLTSQRKVSAGQGHDGSALVKDDRTLTFTAREDFAGLTSVSVEVTDGKDLNDSEGVVALVTLPIEVAPRDNRPPVFTPTPVEVAPGEDPISVDLLPMANDPDEGETAGLRFTIQGAAPGSASASISGTTLQVSVPADTPRGPLGSIRVRVDDAKGAKVEADVPVVVVSSSRPLIQTTPAQVTLDAGNSTTVDITQYATNPFADRGPLAIEGEPSAGEGGQASATGTQVTVTANSGFNGTFTVSYTLNDVTKDPSRQVRGTITATVRDKPGAPLNLGAQSNSSGTALLSWTAGPANGAPIQGFTVIDHTQGDSKQCGLVTQCLFEGRKNGVEHSFSVTATNEVGESEPSNQASTMIDIEPEAPAAPTLAVGDREVTVSWEPPRNEGSALTEYAVVLEPGHEQSVPASQTRVTFTGLSNGSEYRAKVVARNAKGASPASAYSIAAVPYGAPGPVSGVAASYGQLGSGQGTTATVDVSWQPPANTNGRAIEYYTVSGGGISKQVPGTQTSTSLQGVGYADRPVEFSVTATNDGAMASVRTSPAASATAWVVGSISAPRITSVKASGNDQQVRIQWEPSPAGQGWRPSDLTYQWSAGGAWQNLTDMTITGNGLVNGQASSIRIRAVGTKLDGQTVFSQEVSSSPVTPFGQPSLGSVQCSGANAVGEIRCSWAGATGNGRPASIEVTGNVQRTMGLQAEGSVTFNVGEGGSGGVCVQVWQQSDEVGRRATGLGDGQRCKNATARAFARNRGIYQGPDTKIIGGSGNGQMGKYVGIELSSWPPYASVTCSGSWDSRSVSTTINVDQDGYYRDVPKWTGGFNGKIAAAANLQDDTWTTKWFSCRQN